MSYLFISYSNKDREIADSVLEHLEYNGYECWIDIERLRFGKWTQTIEKAVKNSRAVVLIVTDNSSTSKWVKQEIGLARNNKIPVIPLEYKFSNKENILNELVWELQRIKITIGNPIDWIIELCYALKEEGIEPIPADPNDERILRARNYEKENMFDQAISELQKLIERRSSHLPAVVELITCLYNYGRFKILDEEQRGLRPHYDTQMISEFYYAETIATHYIHSRFGPQDNEFRSLVWHVLGMISSFLGRYDDAIKRFKTAISCDNEITKSKEYLKTMLEKVSKSYIRDEYGIEFINPYDKNSSQYPDPIEHSSWYSIAFTFTPVISQKKFLCPENVTTDWKYLWLIDHNISLLERELIKKSRTFGGPKSWQLYMIANPFPELSIELTDSMDINILFNQSANIYNKIENIDILALAAKRIKKAIINFLPSESDHRDHLASLKELPGVKESSKMKLNEFWVGQL